MAEVMAKGPNFVFAKKFILQEYKADIWGQLLASVPSDVATIWRDTPLFTSSYPFGAFKSVVTSLSKVLGMQKEAETARLYEYIAENSLNVLYKIFFQLTNPSFVIKNYPKLWSRFFDAGKVEVPVTEKGHAIVKFTLPEIFLDWLSPACRGYSKKAVEMGGGRGLMLHQVSKSLLADNTWEIIYELNWVE
jgi:hypothetical protein